MIGQTVAHYRIVKKLASGGMADVYLAQDERTNQEVALKILRGKLQADPEKAARFVREAKAASSLVHPNIAHIYQVGEADGVRFLAMQYLQGETLDTRLGDQPCPVEEVIDIGLQVADALDEAHAKGIIHRDIKPANILITTDGQVKVLDFGIAKITHHDTGEPIANFITRTGAIIGTLPYMSPEQAMGNQIDARSDLFSLGSVLYHLSTGRLPFPGKTVIETLKQIVTASPSPPRQLNPNIPLELERIIMKCLEKNPQNRYATSRDFYIDLRHLKRSLESARMRTGPMLTGRAKSLRRWIAIGLFVLAGAIFVWSFRSQKNQTVHSLAVLPFLIQNDIPDQEYLGDGLTDSTINALSRLPNLKVLARSTVFSYKGKMVDPREAGRELNVDALVTGRIVQQAGEISINVSLVKTSDGVQLWGREYRRKLSNLFDIENVISTEIANQLRLKLSGKQKEQLTKHSTQNPEAYRSYLLGRYHWNKRTKEGFLKAIESFHDAQKKDPNYALPQAGLADTYILLANWGFLGPREAYTSAREAANKALSLDDSIAEAWTSRAAVKADYDWDWKGAEQDFRKALELNPNYATAHHWYSFYLSQVGRHQEALYHIQTALTLDPLSLIIHANYGYTEYVARNYEAALVQLQKTLDLNPQFALAYQYLGYVYEQKRMSSESIAALEKAVSLSPNNMTFRADLARAQAMFGDREKAVETYKELTDHSKQQYVSPYDLANICVGLGEKERALGLLETAYYDHSAAIGYIRMEPRMDPLRAEPRFKKLVAEIGLPD